MSLLPGDWSWTLDGWIVLAGMLCAVAAALLGNFLVLRRLSLLGDAVSHAILPGLAAAFFLSDSRSSWPMFAGAVVVGVITAVFTEWIRSVGRVDEGASMGVVFTSLFALGLVLIVRAADHVDLDPSCVLYGAIELTPLDVISLGDWQIPRAVITLAGVAAVNGLFVLCFFKELAITSFDPALATTQGFSAKWMHYLLMVLVAITAVASFESVGNILVVAMFIVPPATAYLLTDRLPVMIWLSLLVAVMAAVFGHLGALVVPRWFGFGSTTTAGMMAVTAGILLGLAVLFAPRHGVLLNLARRWSMSWRILNDDLLAMLYRIEERGSVTRGSLQSLAELLLAERWSVRAALLWLQFRRQVTRRGETYHLTSQGLARAEQLVRTHRLWEHYLVTEVGMDTDRIHEQAERFEHFTSRRLHARLSDATRDPAIDPHGSPIPLPAEAARDPRASDHAG